MPRECVPDAAQVGGAPVVVRDRESRSHGEGGQLKWFAGGLTDHSEVKTFDNQ